MISLEDYGWRIFSRNNISIPKDHEVGRVISVQGFKYQLITSRGELEAELSGKLLYGSDSEALPKVGDWILFLDYGQIGYINSVLPRVNALSRKDPGSKTKKQILACNIDHALIVQGLDRDFNIMRLERYITQITSCKIDPIIVLNKSDLAEDLEWYGKQFLKLKRDCKILFCSTRTGAGIDDLERLLLPEHTYIMIGSSGVGKSSLSNILLGNDVQRTNSVSTFNNKGTHTTTTRDLFRLKNGSLLIDTPGMREFGVTNDDAGGLSPAIEDFARSCRYTDCKHENQEGCAVIAALNEGLIDPEIYESYLKLAKEMKRFEIKIEDRKRLNKQFGRMTREAKNHRRRWKY
jgi:ribosome biogenesis GTPase